MTITKIGHVFVDIPPSFMGSKFNPFVISARQELLLSSLGLNLENNILTNIFSLLCLVNHFQLEEPQRRRYYSAKIRKDML